MPGLELEHIFSGDTIQPTIVFGENKAEKGSASMGVSWGEGQHVAVRPKGTLSVLVALVGQHKNDLHLLRTLGIQRPTQSSDGSHQEPP